MLRFSPSTGCFYPDDIAYATIPDDAIEATPEQFAAAMVRAPTETIAVIDGAVQVVPASGPSLEDARAAQIAAVNAAFTARAAAPVTFTTAAGATARFDQTDQARAHLSSCIDAGADEWTANVWLDADNTPVMPFAFADLQGLAAAIDAAHTPSYADFLALVAAIASADTIAAVQAIAL